MIRRASRPTVDRLGALRPSLVVLEATGGYETALVAAGAAAGLPVVVANPRQVRDFAKATGQLATTDRLDAQLLALFAERVHPTPRPLPDAVLRHLDALMTRRRQLLDMLTAEGTRLEHAAAPIRRESLAISAGSSAVSRPSTVISMTPSRRARSGGRKRTCFVPHPASAPS